MKKAQEEEKQRRLELYSPQLKHIFADVPRCLTFWLVAVSLIIIAGIALILVLMPYPHGSGESLLSHLIG